MAEIDCGAELCSSRGVLKKPRVNPMQMTFFHFLALLMLLPNNALAKGCTSIIVGQAQQAGPLDIVPTAPQTGHSQSLVTRERHPRLFWIVPTYTISNSKLPMALSSSEKFQLFRKNLTDPYTLTFTAFSAGVEQANNDLAGYGQGAVGYGKRLGAALADETSAGFFRAYLFPSLLHQDPRYFRQGSGPFEKRFAHAILRPVVTRKDSGGRAFNWSGLLGLIAANGLTNAYYPQTDRGAERTFKRVATGIPFSMIDHLIDEFGPDLEKKFLGRN